jgi:hypothetical protein
MQENQRVSDMALEVLARQASTRSKRTGEPFEEGLEAVLATEAGRQLRELSEGPHRYESAHQWQEDLPRKRTEERIGRPDERSGGRPNKKSLAEPD